MKKIKVEYENTYINERVEVLIPLFEKLSQSKLQKKRRDGFNLNGEDLTGWKMLAVNESALLKQYYPDEKPDTDKTYDTITRRQIPALKKQLKIASKTELLDPANYNPVNTIINHFGEHLSSLFAEYLLRSNENQREARKERATAENRIEVDLTEWLVKANQVLTEVSKGYYLKENWRDVSCSIALCVGRRMSEIHQTAEFTKVDDYTITFKGQLKGKSRTIKNEQNKDVKLINHTFTIPTLVKADLVINALNWLGENNKRISTNEDTELVNRRYSKVLNLMAKEWAIIEGMTYHKFRGCYLIANVDREKIHNYDYFKYATSILGDEDSSTILAYQRFNLKEGSLNRI